MVHPYCLPPTFIDILNCSEDTAFTVKPWINYANEAIRINYAHEAILTYFYNPI